MLRVKTFWRVYKWELLGTTLLLQIATFVHASNGSFARLAGGVSATSDAFAHSFDPENSPNIVTDTDADISGDEPLARAESSATTNTINTLASSYGVSNGLLVTPSGSSTFTPQVTVTSFLEDFASISGPALAVAENDVTVNGATSSATFRLDLESETEITFHGFLYLVGI